MKTVYLDKIEEPYRKTDGQISLFTQNAVHIFFDAIDLLAGALLLIIGLVYLFFPNPTMEAAVKLSKLELLAIMCVFVAAIKINRGIDDFKERRKKKREKKP